MHLAMGCPLMKQPSHATSSAERSNSTHNLAAGRHDHWQTAGGGAHRKIQRHRQAISEVLGGLFLLPPLASHHCLATVHPFAATLPQAPAACGGSPGRKCDSRFEGLLF